MYGREKLATDIRNGRLFRFDSFLIDVQINADQLPTGVREIHNDFFSRIRKGDPTPLKRFGHRNF
jgi:hypothetical protein